MQIIRASIDFKTQIKRPKYTLYAQWLLNQIIRYNINEAIFNAIAQSCNPRGTNNYIARIHNYNIICDYTGM